MECITTVSYSIKINGQVEGAIKPSRGLRQGAHLSPYLFISYAEGLSSILHVARQANLLKSIRMTWQWPPISHLFFAGDSFMFGQANFDEAAMYETMIQK